MHNVTTKESSLWNNDKGGHMRKIKISLLHLLLQAGNISNNMRLIEEYVLKEAENGSQLIVTPELAVSGLQFKHLIGCDWISEQPNEWMKELAMKMKPYRTTVLIGSPEREGPFLFNSVFVLGQEGKIIGKQRKFNSIIDDWSSPGEEIEVFDLGGVKIGIMICADAYIPSIADKIYQKGAEIIVAPSSWGPGLYGPEGEWEQRSVQTGLPVFVCNRTGEDRSVSFWEAESAVILNGQKIFLHKSRESTVLTFEWNVEERKII